MEYLTELVKEMEKSLEAITKWLKKSGLKVNENRTQICLKKFNANLFYYKICKGVCDHYLVNIRNLLK